MSTRTRLPADESLSFTLAPGYVVEWHPDPEWRLLPADSERLCRRGGRGVMCENRAVVEFNRPAWPPRGDRWWAYCADHMYGRRIRDGVVEGPRVVFATGGRDDG